MRQKLVSTLEEDYSVVGAVPNGEDMLHAEATVNPDVIVLDIAMPVMNGIEAATRLKERESKARIVFLTMHEEPEFLEAALAAGALGYVVKTRLASDLPLAISEVMAGRRFVSPCLG